MKRLNRQIVLARRPSGALVPGDFASRETAVPEPRAGQLLLRNRVLSIDPYLRGRMDDGPGYAPPFALGEPPPGETLSEVVASDDARFVPGDLVVAAGGWQDFAVIDADAARTVSAELPQPSWALGPLGMTGFTAWYGLARIGVPQPGETVLVSAAAGAVGSIAGQIARLRGARVVGIAGGPQKCRFVIDELGFDDCVDRKDPAFGKRLATALPGGVDVYFENLGGEVFDAVWPLLNDRARVPVCGVISGYDGRTESGELRWSSVAMGLIVRRIRVEGFMNADHADVCWNAFQAEVQPALLTGSMVAFEDVSAGLARAPEALIGVLAGTNVGKAVVRI